MKPIRPELKICLALATAAVVLASASQSAALDAYQDRRGLFSGISMGGGAAIVPDGDTGGEILLDFQLGGGATENLTLCLDVDVMFQLFDAYQNWLVVPGPELNFFVWEGLYLRVGFGMALTFVRGEEVQGPPTPGSDVEDNDFALGFDAGAGLGYEFFATSNLAMGLGVEFDYYLIDDHDDVMSVGFSFGIRYY
jgi:hypothetical protein